METPRDIAKRHRPGSPVEDELEDDIARHVIAKDRRIADLEKALEIALSVRMLDNLSEEAWRQINAARKR